MIAFGMERQPSRRATRGSHLTPPMPDQEGVFHRADAKRGTRRRWVWCTFPGHEESPVEVGQIRNAKSFGLARYTTSPPPRSIEQHPHANRGRATFNAFDAAIVSSPPGRNWGSDRGLELSIHSRFENIQSFNSSSDNSQWTTSRNQSRTVWIKTRSSNLVGNALDIVVALFRQLVIESH